MAEIKATYNSVADFGAAFENSEVQEGDRIEVHGYVANIGEIQTSKQKGNQYRIVEIKETLGAKGYLRVMLGKFAVNLITAKDVGQKLGFRGELNISVSGFPSLGWAVIVGRSSGSGPGKGSNNYNPYSYIVGMMYNQAMARLNSVEITFTSANIEKEKAQIAGILNTLHKVAIASIEPEDIKVLYDLANPTSTAKPKESIEENPFGDE